MRAEIAKGKGREMSEAQVRTELIAIDAGDGIVLNGAAWLPDPGHYHL